MFSPSRQQQRFVAIVAIAAMVGTTIAGALAMLFS